jgi:hypothetical protein
VLKSSGNHAKLVARVFAEGNTQNPASIGAFEFLSLLASWFWVGFVTFPRILREAWKLYFKRKLAVFFRPEVMSTSLGRKHTKDEAYVLHSMPTLSGDS